jgi:uncharacterized protein with HEPN domain
MPRDETYLLYMLLAARRIVRYASDINREQFDANDQNRDAIVLQLGNIGEAAGHIGSEFRKTHQTIPWNDIIGMRHRLFHGYETIDWDIVWNAATVEVPNLIKALESIVPPDGM